MENREITTTPTDEEFISAALDFIRVGGPDRDGCIVSIGELLEEWEKKFGDHFRLSPEQWKLLGLIDWVAAEPRVDLIGFDGIGFGWRGETSGFANN
jgi:hypothetical protein